MVLGNFAENVRVLHGFGFFGRSTDFVAALGGQKNAAAGVIAGE